VAYRKIAGCNNINKLKGLGSDVNRKMRLVTKEGEWKIMG
jgi:hypothetical protein